MTVAATFEIEYLQYLGADGKPVAELPAAFGDPKALLPLFKQMLFVRTFDSKAIALQRTGKLGTYASCLGHEATHVGSGASMPRYAAWRFASSFLARVNAARASANSTPAVPVVRAAIAALSTAVCASSMAL